MEDSHNRKRSFNIDKLTPEEADRIGADLGDKVRELVDQACEKANKLLNIYGMKVQMQFVIKGIDEELSKTVPDEAKKKRGRPKKASQSLS
jgi:hypothetical protein